MEVKWGEEEKRGRACAYHFVLQKPGISRRRAVPVQSTNDLFLSSLPPIPPPNQGRACKDPDSGAAVEPQVDGSRYLGAASEPERRVSSSPPAPKGTENDELGEFMCPFYFSSQMQEREFFFTCFCAGAPGRSLSALSQKKERDGPGPNLFPILISRVVFFLGEGSWPSQPPGSRGGVTQTACTPRGEKALPGYLADGIYGSGSTGEKAKSERKATFPALDYHDVRGPPWRSFPLPCCTARTSPGNLHGTCRRQRIVSRVDPTSRPLERHHLPMSYIIYS